MGFFQTILPKNNYTMKLKIEYIDEDSGQKIVVSYR